MKFLTNGDFGFPLQWAFYSLSQLYTWSYNTGAANLDGIIRMPAHLLYMVIFRLFGNLTFEYFYIFSTLLVAFISFYLFAGKMLGLKNWHTKTFAALFFAINPIFLGNLSKTGLILASAMLPLALICAKQAAEHNRYRSYIYWILVLNISFIHPFTLAVNAAASIGYFIYKLYVCKDITLRDRFKKISIVFVIALALNAYFIMPILSMHTVSKDALSSAISSTPTDYASLVDTLNTQDIFTGLSLSKNILLDFNFYNHGYQLVYFSSIFLFYVLLLGVYISVKKRLSRHDSVVTAVLMLVFLALTALATVNFLGLSTLIKLLISLPGGWAFRSPLKWQLYIPFTIFAILAVMLRYVHTTLAKRIVYGGLTIIFILMNGYLTTQVYQKLLRPRTVTTFAALQAKDFTHQNALFINTDACNTFRRFNTRVMNEFNEIVISKNLQIKQVSQSDARTLNIGSYDYVFSCQNSVSTLLGNYAFTLDSSFDGNAIQLYANKKPVPFINSTDTLYHVAIADVDAKYSFVNSNFQKTFNFTKQATPTYPVTHLSDIFEGLDYKQISNKTIASTTHLQPQGTHAITIQNSDKQFYYKIQNDTIAMSAQDQAGYQTVAANARQTIAIPGNTKTLKATYTDTTYTFANMIANPSLESGLWQKKVSDCYAYDNNPALSMKLISSSNAPDGSKSLQLASRSHIACTGPSDVRVTPGQQYLFGFNYESLKGQYGGYSVTFNDPSHTIYDGRLDTTTGWKRFTQTFTAPPKATSAHLLVYAFPKGLTGRGQASYDNFAFAAIPNIQHQFYVLDSPTAATITKPSQTTYKIVSPTTTSISIKNATKPFYLTMNDTYSQLWHLQRDDGWKTTNLGISGYAVSSADHTQLNGYMNGWYVDPAEVCASKSVACTRHSDGSYDIALVATFGPQKWFYVGTIVTAITVFGCVIKMYYIPRRRATMTQTKRGPKNEK